MAAGDLAASQAGFVPALSSDDLRLGFGKIDEAADLAFRYGPLSFASSTPLLAFTGAALGQLAVDRGTGDVYRWNGSSWRLWERQATNFTPAFSQGLTLGAGVASGKYGVTAGVIWVGVGISAGTGYALSATADVLLTLPGSLAYRGQQFQGQGHYLLGGSSASQVALTGVGIGAWDVAQPSVRVRALSTPSAAPLSVREVIAGSIITASTTDVLQFFGTGPLA